MARELTSSRHEHYKRSPGCQFFLLLNQYEQGPTKKSGRGKGARTSKASRLSVQSATTAASNSTLLLDHPAEHDDSVMTATSVMTQGSTKRGRTKKATTARGKKTRAKKDEVVEVLEDPPEMQEEAPPPPKPARGRKRASDAIEDSVMTTTEAPAPKKRATRGRRSNTVDTSIVDHQHDVDVAETKPAPPAKAKGKKGRSSNTRNTRKASVASNVSITSIAEADDEHLLDDEALNRQLEADLDRPLSDDENIDADSDSERKKVPAKPKKATTKKGAATKQEETQNHHSMFDPTPAEVDEDDVDAELKALEAEMEVEPAEKLQVPKKGRKAGTRKVSKQTKKTQKPAPVEPEPEPKPDPEPELVPEIDEGVDVDELAEGHEESMMSNATVLNKRTSSIEPPKKKRGRPSKKASLAKAASEAATEPARLPSVAKSSPKIAHTDFAQSAQSQSQQGGTPSISPPPQVLGYPTLPTAQDEDEDEYEAQDQEQQRPATPEAPAASTSSAKQATISPSHSPQSSDAENQPPSSRPSNTTSRSSGARAALAPVAAAGTTTPVRSSPSKSSRGYHQSHNSNTLGNLQSSHPWIGVDLEMVFDNLDRENKENPAALTASRYLNGDGNGKGNADPLTSPEKRMTVEEWVHHNASQAEQKLRLECEATVSAFEREGTRAMMALEGLVIE
ncbi:hypothetical protein SLS62_007256 [Diatrype stigma]|uniref:Uncharacterized protein n=1 Tax=Diatrype stigma TaxID=117547 RepID=A0AAN9YQJ0_9PEZI